MKSINIKSLTLMMLITMVYARPHVYINRHNGTLKKNDGINVTKETLLKEIKEEAKHILSNAELCSKSVTFIKSINGITCVPNFFCYARKSLSIFKDEEEEKDISVLKRYLYQYIKFDSEVCNSQTKTVKISLSDLMKDIINCVQHDLN